MSTPAKPRFVSNVRPLTSDDLSKLFEPAHKNHISVKAIRDSHHRIARLAAAGLRQFQIAEQTGYAPNRLSIILDSPAMKELIAHYRGKVDEAFVAAVNPFVDLATSNMLLAEGQLNDRLLAADEEGGIPISTKDLIAISRDAADRLGFGKRSMVTNLNVDFAAALEKANERSKNMGATPSQALEIAADA